MNLRPSLLKYLDPKFAKFETTNQTQILFSYSFHQWTHLGDIKSPLWAPGRCGSPRLRKILEIFCVRIELTFYFLVLEGGYLCVPIFLSFHGLVLCHVAQCAITLKGYITYFQPIIGQQQLQDQLLSANHVATFWVICPKKICHLPRLNCSSLCLACTIIYYYGVR